MNIGMNTAVQALLAAQRALDVAGHNIANADTPGFSRQRMDLAASEPMGKGGLTSRYGGVGQVGSGVTVTQIKRVRDLFIDRQARAESGPLGEAKVTSDTLRQVEDIFGEPSDRSLGTLMTRFWDAWHDLAGNPENADLRINLREVSRNVAAVFQEIYGKLAALREDVNGRIETTVADINSATSQIAQLNGQIQDAYAAGQNPNDILDKQDLLLEQLSEKLKIQVVELPSSGMRNVYIGGQPLVTGITQYKLDAVPQLVNGFFDVMYPPSNQPAVITGGSLKGLLDMRNITLSDTDPKGFVTQVNDLAAGFIASVNAVHTTGFGLDGTTGMDFFQGTNASDMAVNQNITDLANGIDFIAAALDDPGSLTGGPGDNGNAVKLAQLRNQLLMSANQYSFDDYYKGVLTQAGTQGQEAQRKVDTQDLLLAAVKERRDQASGVSTDEEMANVMKFQKAYAAAARILTTMDEMLDRLMSTGLVGR